MPRMVGPDPFEAMTVAEAALAAGVSEHQVRRRIQGGELLHEVGRRGGREVQLVRRVDLAQIWPAVLPGREAPETPEMGTGGEDEPSREPPPPPPPPGDEGLREERDHLSRRSHAFEVRLAALQSANEALGSQVRDLQVQRSDLKDQCADLRGRLTLIERERQASTAGLLLAQRRLLELEAAVPAYAPAPAWWRRPVTWSVVSLFLLVGLGWGWQWREARGERSELAEVLDAQDRERARVVAELQRWDETVSTLERELARERASREEERRLLEEARREDAAALAAELEAERERAEAGRERFARTLDETLEGHAAARQDRLEERAALLDTLAGTRTALAEDREAFRAELDRRVHRGEVREAALHGELEAAREVTEALRSELERQARDAEARTARLEELELRARREQAREQARELVEGLLAALRGG